MVTLQFMESCMRLQEELLKVGMEHQFAFGRNESLVTRARNELTRTFLETKFTHQMWLDADMQFEPEDVAKVWNLSVGGFGDRPADIVVGIYAMKLPDKPLSAWKDGKLVVLSECPSKPFEVDFAGTGFMLIRRHVVEHLAEKAETYEGPNGRTAAIYMTPIHDDGFESEDYNFCRKARECGYKIIADPSIKLGHWGQYRYGA